MAKTLRLDLIGEVHQIYAFDYRRVMLSWESYDKLLYVPLDADFKYCIYYAMDYL
jgi:hypothetical protein